MLFLYMIRGERVHIKARYAKLRGNVDNQAVNSLSKDYKYYHFSTLVPGNQFNRVQFLI